MKTVYMIIGTMLVLMLCISPVVAVSGSDFEIEFDDYIVFETYKYSNQNNLSEKYIHIIIITNVERLP